MARVAVAYVEVRPELSKGFRTQLNAQLEAVNKSIKVKIEPDMRGMSDAVSGQVERSMKGNIKAAQQYGKLAFEEDAKAEARKYALRQEYAKKSFADGQKLIAEGLQNHELAEKFKAKVSEDYAKKSFAEGQRLIAEGLKDHELAERFKAKVSEDYAKKSFAEGQRLLGEGIRDQEAADSETLQRRLAYQRVVYSQMQSEIAAGLRDNHRFEEDRELAMRRLLGRRAAEVFADNYADEWRTRMTKITVHESRDIERSMIDRFGSVGSTVARAFIRDFNKEVDKRIQRQADRTGAGFLKRFASSIKGGGQITRILGGIFTGVAGVAETMGKVAAGSFELMGKGLGTLLSQFSATSGLAQSFTQGLGQAGAVVGSLVEGLTAASLVAALVSTAVVALNLVLGALLAVVIPLVGGITALVAELTALAGVGIGAIGLLPGALAAAAAAFGPLLIVGDRFQKLFEDTAKHTGTLFVALERLKNAIWAVLGTGFVAAIQGFVANTLPKLFGGIEAVSAAWGRLLTGLVRLASTEGAIRAFNALLTQGAMLVDAMAGAVDVLGPALLAMAIAAQPALSTILDSVQMLVTTFADWMTQLAASGQMTTFFNTIAVILGQIMQILPPLAELMGTWIAGTLGPVAQFVTLLGAMVDRWVALATSAEGMALIRDFFLAMNTIVASFEPLLEQVVIMFLRFGPTLAALTTTAIPALQTLLGTLMNLATAVAPAVMTFLDAFATALADPAVQASVTALGVAFGELLTAFTANSTMFESVFTLFAQLMQVLSPLVTVLMAVLAATTPLTNVLLAVLIPVLDLLLKILQPVIGALEWFARVSNKSVEPTLKVVSWLVGKVAQALQWFWENLVKSLTMIGQWLEKLLHLQAPLKWLGDKLTWLGQKMGITGKAATGMGTDTKNATDKMVGGLNGVAGAKAWNVIASNAQSIGDYLVDGVNVGISGAERYITALNAMGAAAYAAKNEVDMATFEKNVGRAMNKTFQLNRAAKGAKKSGLAAGSAFMDGYNESVSTKFETSTKKASTAGKMTAAGYISTFKAELSKLSGFTIIKGNTAYNTGKEIARYIAKGITSGKKNIDRVARYIGKTYGKKLTEIVNKNKDFRDGVKANAKALPGFDKAMKKFTTGKELDDWLANAQQKQKDLLAKIVDFKAQAKDALTAGADLVGYFGFIPTPAEVQARLDALQKQMLDFTTGLADLQKRGLSKELAAQWLLAGPDQAGNLVKAGAAATDEQLKQWSASFASIGTAADAAADTAATNFFGVGQSTVEGYIKGIQSMRNAAGKEMTALIDYVYKQVKTKLKIKSPSQVYAGLGANTVAGYNQGVAGMQGRAVRQVNRLMDAVRSVPAADLAPPRVRIPTVGNGALADRAQRNEATYVRVFVGNRELTDIVRVEQQRMDETRARALYAGRKGV